MLRIIGVLLFVAGLMALVQGRIAVPNIDTIVEDIPIPPLVGGLAMAAGVVLVMNPRRGFGAF